MGINLAMVRGGSNPILTQGGTGAWDEGKIGPMNIVKMGPTDYRMWYEGINLAFSQVRIGYATSTDGTTWSKYGSNPVFAPSEAWEGVEVAPDTVIWDQQAGVFKMWYHGGGPTDSREIGYATSSDGITWTRGNGSLPVLSAGTGGSWDDASVADACVIKISPTDYRMWFIGKQSGGANSTGYATSSDGISWTKSGSNPVFGAGTAGQWDDGTFYGLWVIRRECDKNLGFHAWYAADDGTLANATATGIGYAFSADGISWVRGRNNPVLVGTTSPEEWISDPVFAYEDPRNQTIRLIYFWDDFGASPVERVHGEATVNLDPTMLTATESVRTDTSDPYTFNVTPQGLPRGVAITAVHGTSSTDHIAGITYGGVSMTRVQTNTDTATEAGRSDVWFLGEGIPTGTQTVSVDLTSATTDDFQFVCFVLYANGDMQVIDTDGINENVANPSVTLQYSGRSALAVAALYGGGANITDFAPNANCSGLAEDLGAFYAYGIIQNTAGTTDFAIGGTAVSDDVAFSAAAFAARTSLLTNPRPLAHLRAR